MSTTPEPPKLPDAFNHVMTLAPRQYEVLMGLGQGESVREIAKKLGIAHKTVDAIMQQLYSRVPVKGAHRLRWYAARFVFWCELHRVTCRGSARWHVREVVFLPPQ